LNLKAKAKTPTQNKQTKILLEEEADEQVLGLTLSVQV